MESLHHPDVTLGPYIPHNAYLMTATWEVAEKVRQSEGVSWVGVWRDEFKMKVVEDEEAEAYEEGRILVELAPSKRWSSQEGNYNVCSIVFLMPLREGNGTDLDWVSRS